MSLGDGAFSDGALRLDVFSGRGRRDDFQNAGALNRWLALEVSSVFSRELCAGYATSQDVVSF